jgi:hypothetical protein
MGHTAYQVRAWWPNQRSKKNMPLTIGKATNPFAGFSASAQAITIAGRNALIQSAQCLKDFTTRFVRFLPPSETQMCVYGDTGARSEHPIVLPSPHPASADSIMCSTSVRGFYAVALQQFGLAVINDGVLKVVEQHSEAAAAHFNKRYEVRKGMFSKLEHEICLTRCVFTSRKMYLSINQQVGMSIPEIENVPPRELLVSIRQFEERVNALCPLEKIRGYVGIKRSTERYLASTQLCLLKLLCIGETDLAFEYLWQVMKALAYQRFPLFSLSHNVRRKKKEYDSGKLSVVLQNWREYLPIGGTLSMVMISTKSRPRKVKQASDSLVPVSIALARRYQPDTAYYVDKLVKTVKKSCKGVLTEEQVAQRLCSSQKQAAMSVMCSTVEKKAVPANSVAKFFSAVQSPHKTRCVVCFNTCAKVGDRLCSIRCKAYDPQAHNAGKECESVSCHIYQKRAQNAVVQGGFHV